MTHPDITFRSAELHRALCAGFGIEWGTTGYGTNQKVADRLGVHRNWYAKVKGGYAGTLALRAQWCSAAGVRMWVEGYEASFHVIGTPVEVAAAA